MVNILLLNHHVRLCNFRDDEPDEIAENVTSYRSDAVSDPSVDEPSSAPIPECDILCGTSTSDYTDC